jgi:hypothetical protein
MKKQSFTLIEVLISIVLLLIIVVFLYQTLDISQKSNKFFHDKLVEQTNKTNVRDIFFMDILYLNSSISTSNDKNKNTIFSFQTSNTYHNAFYENITYLVSKNNNLLRIESKKKFDKNKLYDFFDTAYIDTIASNIDKFKVIKKANKQYAIYLKFKDESDMMFVLQSIR